MSNTPIPCLNTTCQSTDANEINVSVNLSLVKDGEYSGYTEYGDTSASIGTSCEECGLDTYLPNAAAIITVHLIKSGVDVL